VLVAAPRWIMDGNYAATLAERLARADAAILLDCPRWLCLLRVLRRAVRSLGRTRGEDMAPGCPERIDWPFLLYIWRYGRDHGPRVAQALAAFPGEAVVLRGRRDAARYLDRLTVTAA
jgi:adenylate kinase family enzyme